MNNVLDRLLSEDFKMWDNLIDEYERTNRSLKVPEINETAIHFFNVRVEEEYTKALYDFGRARRNKDAIQRLLKSVLEDLYEGKNEQARKAGGIQYAREFPAPEFWHEETVNLFDLEDLFVGYYYSLEATVKSLQAKADAKVTNNSLLKIENTITTN
ncbi:MULTISPECIES: hypothetical protein [Bacillus subtilis group]|uniref:hypothetical protein n=1 Tax=Bacillus subtilis group TaxID=653685 RepID=UPI0009B7DC48|nr:MULTISPECIES: hypothetical protein [Bacillus subtilis group]ARC67288.1 hypothetical protein B14_200077 [Bacillus licheniformis]ARW46071.1 hypothetical protein S100141_04851 [Bacillus licheniformis]MCY1628340.1 hypothetical protein [Bacillus paralicheniformis]MDE1421943.1 hypothetical protein [Bacillus licheniformis]MEC0475948.1 hypothetical protein [Bacillus licheniformis]